MLDREHDFYYGNRNTLFTQHKGKAIVIKGQQVIGIYDNHEEAYNETRKEHQVGTFIIKSLTERKTSPQ